MTVAAFMAEALGHPQYGYYARQDPFGAAGDFVTAPEISQMFGELLGLWCVERWVACGKPASFHLVELGPGRGTLMMDALRAARKAPGFLEAADIHLIETSPALRAVQRERLAGATVSWADNLAEIPPGPLLLIANEFFDALPIRQFVRMPAGWHERLIGWSEDSGFGFTVGAGQSPMTVALPAPMRDAPVGAVAEICPAAIAIAAEIGRRIASAGGAAIIIDYGHPFSAVGDTLQAVRQHAFVPVLANPGMADITAHLDFQMLAQAAREAGADTYGPVPQGAFLRSLGIEHRAAALCGSAPDDAEAILQACRRLIEPDAMGNLFKALAIVGQGQPVPAGFERFGPGPMSVAGDPS